MTEHLMKLDELIPQLKWCGYECEAGKLECNIAFRQIAHIIERLDYTYNQQRKEFNPDAFTKHEYYVECQTCKVDTMKIDVETQCIITRDNGEQVVVDDVSSIAIVIEVMGQKYNIFKTINELILNGRWK